MVTIREALLSVVGENATSIQPIVEALSGLGFNEHEEAGTAFSLLEADQAAGLNVRQLLALKFAIQGEVYACDGGVVVRGSARLSRTGSQLFRLSSSHPNPHHPGRSLLVQLWPLAWRRRGVGASMRSS